MPEGLLRPILDKGAPDEAIWNEWMEPHIGKSWLGAPWFPAETYFFRRILEASGYFQPGPDGGRDPFRSQKREGLNGVRRRLEPICEELQAISAGNPCETLSRLLRTVIWGNQADLSIWPIGGEQPANHAGDDRIAHLLVDHAAVAAKWITSQPGGLMRVDFLLDNVGLELAYDMLLADTLLANDLVQSVCFHPKTYPTYVSDVTVPDFHEMVDHLRFADEPNVRRMGLRLLRYQSEKRITLKTENFWISPLVCWEMDEPTRDGLRRVKPAYQQGRRQLPPLGGRPALAI